jgi:hypothetical protein
MTKGEFRESFAQPPPSPIRSRFPPSWVAESREAYISPLKRKEMSRVHSNIWPISWNVAVLREDFCFFRQKWTHSLQLEAAGAWKNWGWEVNALQTCAWRRPPAARIHLAHTKHILRAPNDAEERLILYSRRSSFRQGMHARAFVIFHLLSSLLQ